MILFVVFITTIAFIFGRALGDSPLAIAGFALIISGLMSLGSYYYSDKMVLTTSNAQPISENDNPQLYHIVQNLAIGDGTPMPKVYLINDPSPNAFATGRDPQHAAIAVTTGILEKLSKTELEGVIAHELSHVKNYDTRLMAVTAILVGFVAILADMFLRNLWWGGLRNRDDDESDNKWQIVFLVLGIIFAILSPLVASLIQLAVSRKREYLADASGVLLTRYPEGLASALEKISSDPRPVRSATNATAHLYISNPFKNQSKSFGNWFSSLFDTHPPIEERIKILRSM